MPFTYERVCFMAAELDDRSLVDDILPNVTSQERNDKSWRRVRFFYQLVICYSDLFLIICCSRIHYK